MGRKTRLCHFAIRPWGSAAEGLNAVFGSSLHSCEQLCSRQNPHLIYIKYTTILHLLTNTLVANCIAQTVYVHFKSFTLDRICHQDMDFPKLTTKAIRFYFQQPDFKSSTSKIRSSSRKTILTKSKHYIDARTWEHRKLDIL